MALSNIFGWNKEDEKDETYDDFDFFLYTKLMDDRQVLLAVRHVEHPMNSRRKNKQPAVQHVEHLTSKKFI